MERVKINGHIENSFPILKYRQILFVTSDVEESGMILYGYPATDKKDILSSYFLLIKKIERLENEIESLNAYIKKRYQVNYFII